MGDPDKRGAQTVALALLGAVLFSRPILSGFDAGDGGSLLGIPPLYLYLFVAWGALIGLLALVMEAPDGSDKRLPGSPTSDDRNGPESP